MNRVILAILLVLGLATTALADAFQLLSGTGALAVGAAVYSGGKLIGYADVQGVLFINVSPGTHQFLVVYQGQQREITLTIKGNPHLQQVRIP